MHRPPSLFKTNGSASSSAPSSSASARGRSGVSSAWTKPSRAAHKASAWRSSAGYTKQLELGEAPGEKIRAKGYPLGNCTKIDYEGETADVLISIRCEVRNKPFLKSPRLR